MVSREYFTDVRNSFLAGFCAPRDITVHAYRRVRNAVGKEAPPNTPQYSSISEERRSELGLRIRDEVRKETAHVTAAYLTGLVVGVVVPGGIAGSIAVSLYERVRKTKKESN